MKIIDQEVYVVTDGITIILQKRNKFLTQENAQHYANSLNYAKSLQILHTPVPDFVAKKARILLEVES